MTISFLKITDGDNGIEIVEINYPFLISVTFLLNLFHFGTSCLF